MPLLIRDADWILTMDGAGSRRRHEDILVEGPEIRAVGPNLAAPGAVVFDARGMIVLPGFVNAHHHFYQTLTRAVPAVERAALFPWLTRLYPVWAGIDEEAVEAGALAACAELLLSGATTTSDHHYLFPRAAAPRLIDAQVRAARRIGIRFHPTRGSMSRGRSRGGLPPDGVVQDADVILGDCRRLLDEVHDPSRFSMCRLGLAPCSPFSVEDELMRGTLELARRRGVRVHTHLAETRDEEEYCRATYGCRPVEHLRRLDGLGPDVWLAHAVHVDDDEIALLARTGTGVAHCPTSNLRLGSGRAPVPAMLAAGVPVGLGVDGSASNDSSNLLAEARMALLVHREGPPESWPTAEQVLGMATRGGARVLGRDDIGAIAPGMAADLALLDARQVAMAGATADPVGAVLFTSPRVHTVIVNGRVVVEAGALRTVDSAEIVERANRASRRLLGGAIRPGD